MPPDQDMRDRLTRVESSVEHLASTQDRISETLDVMRRTLTLNEDNRHEIDELEDKIEKLKGKMARMDAYLKSRWYIMVTVVSILAGIISILFNVL